MIIKLQSWTKIFRQFGVFWINFDIYKPGWWRNTLVRYSNISTLQNNECVSIIVGNGLMQNWATKRTTKYCYPNHTTKILSLDCFYRPRTLTSSKCVSGERVSRDELNLAFCPNIFVEDCRYLLFIHAVYNVVSFQTHQQTTNVHSCMQNPNWTHHNKRILTSLTNSNTLTCNPLQTNCLSRNKAALQLTVF